MGAKVLSKRGKLKFKIGNDYSPRGLFCLLVGIFVAVLTLGLVALSAGRAGQTGKWVALIAIFINLLAIAGFINSFRSLYKRNVKYVYPITAMVLEGLVVLFYIIIYLSGFNA